MCNYLVVDDRRWILSCEIHLYWDICTVSLQHLVHRTTAGCCVWNWYKCFTCIKQVVSRCGRMVDGTKKLRPHTNTKGLSLYANSV